MCRAEPSHGLSEDVDDHLALLIMFLLRFESVLGSDSDPFIPFVIP